MKAKRWNYETKTYDDYELPDGTHIVPSLARNCKVVCASCGIAVPIETMYASSEIHTNVGLSYPVCTDCYDIECAKHKIYYGG